MNQVDAQLLARRITNTWYGGPKLDEWADYLTGLDHQAATEVFNQLRAELDHAPAIATYNRAYRTHTRPPEPEPQPDNDRISLDQYLHRLTQRANAGNVTARHELASWQRARTIPWLKEVEPDRWNITDRD